MFRYTGNKLKVRCDRTQTIISKVSAKVVRHVLLSISDNREEKQKDGEIER